MTTPQILQPIPPGDGSGGVLPSSFVIGDILYADSTSTLHTLAAVAVGSVLVSGGIGAAPAWSATSASKFGSVAIGGAAIGTNALVVAGTANLGGATISASGTIVAPSGQGIQAPTLQASVQVVTASNGPFVWASRSQMTSPSDGVIGLFNQSGNNFTALQFGTANSSFPALKRSGVTLQGRLGDDSAFTQIQAKLTTDTNATTGLTGGVLAATTNASIVLYDGSGQAYRVPCII